MQQRTPGEPRAQSVLASPGPGALLIAVIALALAFLAFATRETGHTARFRAALDDVMDPSLRDVVGGLMPLTSDTPGIVWDAGVTPDRVLVATWTDYDGYTERESQTINLTRDVLGNPGAADVGSVSRVRDEGGQPGRAPATAPRERAPAGAYDRVVELWTGLDDVFRPCPDDEVTNGECRLGLPQIPDGETPDADAVAHSRWFSNNFQGYSSHVRCRGPGSATPMTGEIPTRRSAPASMSSGSGRRCGFAP